MTIRRPRPGDGRLVAAATTGCVAALALSCWLPIPAAANAAPVVRAVGRQLRLGAQPFRVFGFNYDCNGTHPNIEYIVQPYRAHLLRLREDFGEAAPVRGHD